MLQALVQQNPWAQKPLAHCVALEQAAPIGASPQLLIIPFMPQMFGVMHSTLDAVQAVKQASTLQ